MFRLTAKDEDYLETVYRLSLDNDTVGVTDVAKARGVSVPTARAAVAKLIRNELVRQQHYGKIVLNPSGKKLGEELYQVHSVLRQFLTEILLLDPKEAEREACLMEHGLSKTTLKRLTLFLDVVDNCGNGKPGCLRRYKNTVTVGK